MVFVFKGLESPSLNFRGLQILQPKHCLNPLPSNKLQFWGKVFSCWILYIYYICLRLNSLDGSEEHGRQKDPLAHVVERFE